MLIGRGGAADGAVDVRKGLRGGNSDVHDEGNRQLQCDSRGRSRGGGES